MKSRVFLAEQTTHAGVPVVGPGVQRYLAIGPFALQQILPFGWQVCCFYATAVFLSSMLESPREDLASREVLAAISPTG
ncbi:MAG TPA: hypothetical protein VMO00_01445 [Methylomirabilota bacterium]|nr:hypothetical protein [Methylomirabilota bacterium]